jgi:hypothetical protein
MTRVSVPGTTGRRVRGWLFGIHDTLPCCNIKPSENHPQTVGRCRVRAAIPVRWSDVPSRYSGAHEQRVILCSSSEASSVRRRSSPHPRQDGGRPVSPSSRQRAIPTNNLARAGVRVAMSSLRAQGTKRPAPRILGCYFVVWMTMLPPPSTVVTPASSFSPGWLS